MIDVIIPVYGGASQTRKCIESVLASRQASAHEVIVIHDASPEPELSAYVRGLAAQGRVTLLDNERNVGFVHSVNRGMALHEDRDVLLLNSDTEVANDWLDRISACAHRERDIATVTPFSNNATICSYPFEGWQGGIAGGLGLAGLDRLIATVNAGKSVELPTAVGFCMYIRRDSLTRLGLFDAERFPRGYGEENEFCMRAVKAGLRNVLAADVFVYHEGAVSFSKDRFALQEAAGKALIEVHPEYTGRVHWFLKADPTQPLRNAIDAARLELSGEEARHVLAERIDERGRIMHGLWEIEDVAHQRSSQIGQLNRGLEHAGFLVADRDRTIAERNAVIARKDAEIAALKVEISNRDEIVRAHADALAGIHNSRSWRLLTRLSRAKRRILGGAS